MRIRTIKPALWDHERLGGCSDAARLLFIGLVSHADDEGRGRATIAYLKARVWAYADKTLAEVQAAINELGTVVDHDGPLVVFYEVGGERYYSLPSWNRNQFIDRKTPSKLPPPPTKFDEPSTSPRLVLDEPSTQEGKGREGIGRDTLVPRPPAVARPLAEAIVSELQEAGKPVDASKSTGTAPDTSDAVCVDSRPVSGLPTLSQGEKVEALPITRRLVDIWNEGRKAQVKVTTVKIKRISTRLKDGWTEADLAKAIRNLKRSAWHMGQNDRGWVADWEFLFRNSEQVEKWVNFDLARSFDKAIMRERDPHAPPKL